MSAHQTIYSITFGGGIFILKSFSHFGGDGGRGAVYTPLQVRVHFHKVICVYIPECGHVQCKCIILFACILQVAVDSQHVLTESSFA